MDIAGLETSRRFEYRLFDGTVYTIETARRTGADGDENYLKVSAAYHPPLAVHEDKGADPTDRNDAAVKGATDPAENAQRADDRLRPWTYTISTWKYEGWVADRNGLLRQEG